MTSVKKASGAVQPVTYRLRVINGPNARTYRLVLLRNGRPDLDRIVQIGTDHGLLRMATRLPPNGLVLASAERADLLVDFSDLESGSELTVLNTAKAPFDGSQFAAAEADTAASLEGLLPYPRVMRFRVVAGKRAALTVTGTLATDHSPPTIEELEAAPRRAIALVERELDGEPNMLTMRELAPVDDAYAGPVVTLAHGERVTATARSPLISKTPRRSFLISTRSGSLST